MEIASPTTVTTPCSSLSVGDCRSFFVVDEKDKSSTPRSDVARSLLSSVSCSAQSSALRSFVVVPQGDSLELSDVLEQNRRVMESLQHCNREMIPCEQLKMVECLISVLVSTNRALDDLQKMASACLLLRKDYSLGNLKLEQNERNLQALRKSNKYLLSVWRKYLESPNNTGHAMRLASLVSVFNQNITIIQQTRQNISKCTSESDDIKFRQAIQKTVACSQSDGRPCFSTPKDLFLFLLEVAPPCEDSRQSDIASSLKVISETGEPFGCEGWDNHIMAIRELYRQFGESLPSLESLAQWELLNKEEDDESRDEVDDLCESVAYGPNSYWDP